MNTDTRASIRTRATGSGRISITDDDPFGSGVRKMRVAWDHSLDFEANHKAAAQAWLDRFIAPRLAGPVVSRGYAFGNAYYWGWDFKNDDE